MEENDQTPIEKINGYEHYNNQIYIKREDLIGFSFGGNKARKAREFEKEIEGKNYTSIITYGSSSSNHCRVIANLANKHQLKCTVISPKKNYTETYNSRLMKILGAKIIKVPIESVTREIDNEIKKEKEIGGQPFFIQGGGHGNIGTYAYIKCFEEILKQEHQLGKKFDYIFHATGTGTTQAGLICGKIIHRSTTNIVGISIARKKPTGRQIVIKSAQDYLGDSYLSKIEKATIFIDDYVLNGYSDFNPEIDKVIKDLFMLNGIGLNRTYTGKAFWGMLEYLKKNHISNKTILFINTGGTPLFFDNIKELI